LIKEIGLEGTETTTAGELLGPVISHVVATSPSSFACERQFYGAVEEFETAPAAHATKQTVRNQPRYYLVGDVRSPSEQMTMKEQNQLCAAIQGTKAARIKDPDIVQRHQAGWKDWGEQQWNSHSLAFEQQELPAIQDAFSHLFDEPNNLGSMLKELQTVLLQSNMIKSSSIAMIDEPTVETPVRSAENSAPSAMTVEDNDDNDNDAPLSKKRKLGRPARSVSPDNDPWLLEPILSLAKADMKGFAEYELALLAGDSPLSDRRRSTVEDAFMHRGMKPPLEVE
jgi:hypothetical protein